MSNQLIAARSFMVGTPVSSTGSASTAFDGAGTDPVLAALGAYRNRDGGYGHGPRGRPARA
jgi:hypothetical protein